ETGDAAALLVDADQRERVRGMDLRAERGEVIGDVLPEVHHAGEILLERIAQPRGCAFTVEARADEPRPQHAVGEAGELVRHPFTAPAVMPLARRPWTMTKKIMTGIVMMVDAAMMLPQSLECRPKNDFRPIATVYWSVAPPSIVIAKM